MYSRVQTGPKIQFGGLKKGFSSVAYHVSMEFAVARPERLPMATVPRMAMVILEGWRGS